jgi:predicted DCC family thiol-disulfide oxidoreductase YuxK
VLLAAGGSVTTLDGAEFRKSDFRLVLPRLACLPRSHWGILAHGKQAGLVVVTASRLVNEMGRDWKPKVVRDVSDGLILFDGVCILCSWWVRFIIKRDVLVRFRFVPIQSSYGAALAANFGIDPKNPETNVVILGGRAYFKSDAAIRVLEGLPRWSWIGVFAFTSRRIRDWIYDRVARNRYSLFGKTETCLIPEPAIAQRFVFSAPVSHQR